MSDSFEGLIALALEQARVATALPENQDEEAWDSYDATRRALQSQASPGNWDRIASLASHPEPLTRSLVPDVLRYFGDVRVDETVDLLRSMLTVETDDTVIADIGRAFIDLHRPDAARELMLPFRRHLSPYVRLAVVHALDFSQHPDAIAALLELSADCDADVRNWATFHLGDSDPGDRLSKIHECAKLSRRDSMIPIPRREPKQSKAWLAEATIVPCRYSNASSKAISSGPTTWRLLVRSQHQS